MHVLLLHQPLAPSDLTSSKRNLVSNQHHTRVLGSIFLNLLHPIFDIVKALSIIYSISHDDTHRTLNKNHTFVICRCDCFKTVLSCCVPNLHFDFFIVNLNCLYFEVNAFFTYKPMVIRCEGMNLLSHARSRIFVFPTPESPMIRSLTR